MASLTVAKLPRDAIKEPPSHWVGNPPTHFQNPWPSFRNKSSLPKMFQARFSTARNFVPVPDDREGLVTIQIPDWGADRQGTKKTKATWIGHSTFLIEMAVQLTASADSNGHRGLRFLMDPVFCERMGPGRFIGPKRFTPTPCALDDVPLVDAVCISHNHYDHLDIDAVKKLYAGGPAGSNSPKRAAAGMAPLQIFCGLGSKAWFVNYCGVRPEHVTEMDWWDEVTVSVAGAGAVRLACTPSQHGSRRGPGDESQMLWCSFVLTAAVAAVPAEIPAETPAETSAGTEPGTESGTESGTGPGAVYFAGDTGYRTVTDEDVAAGTPLEDLPHCPAFAEIGARYGPFDLALLPIGCYSPRTLMSNVHCSPEDAVAIHTDVRSRLSIGMHYGTVRGGISAQYEDVREPPAKWRAAGEERGLVWNKDIRLCNIGETVVV